MKNRKSKLEGFYLPLYPFYFLTPFTPPQQKKKKIILTLFFLPFRKKKDFIFILFFNMILSSVEIMTFDTASDVFLLYFTTFSYANI